MSVTVLPFGQEREGNQVEAVLNRKWRAEEALEAALRCVQEGHFVGEKVLVVLLDDEAGRYDRWRFQAGMNRMELVGLCEATKFALLSGEGRDEGIS